MGNPSASVPEAPVSKQFLQSGGIRWLQVESAGVIAPICMIQDQADVVYISAHGSSATGAISSSGVTMITPDIDLSGGQWGQDLDTVIVAGCAVLDIGNYNQRYNSMNNPGQKWAATGPKLFLGYNWTANTDNAVGDKDWTSHIAKRLMNFEADGMDPVDAWKQANFLSPGLTTNSNKTKQRPYNASVIDLRDTDPAQHTYRYFDQTQNPPVWTSRLRPTWPPP